jgi:hypothetical protein
VIQNPLETRIRCHDNRPFQIGSLFGHCRDRAGEGGSGHGMFRRSFAVANTVCANTVTDGATTTRGRRTGTSLHNMSNRREWRGGPMQKKTNRRESVGVEKGVCHCAYFHTLTRCVLKSSTITENRDAWQFRPVVSLEKLFLCSFSTVFDTF